MTKSKVLDLAREVGMEDDKLLLKLKRMGVKVRDKKATEPEKKVSSSDEKIIKTDSEKEIVEKRVKPTVIRRRARTLEVKVEVAPPPAAVIEPEIIPEVIQGKMAEAKEIEERSESELRIAKKPVEKGDLRTGEQPLTKPARGKKEKETPKNLRYLRRLKRKERRFFPQASGGRAARVVVKEGKRPSEVKKEAEEPKPMEAPLKKVAAKLLEKEELLERERLGPLAKKKGFVKKKKRIEERMLGKMRLNPKRAKRRRPNPFLRPSAP